MEKKSITSLQTLKVIGSFVPIPGAAKFGKFVGKGFVLGAEFLAKNPEILGKKISGRNAKKIPNDPPDFTKKTWSDSAKKGTVGTENLAEIIEGQIIKAGTEAGGGLKHHIDIDANLLKREINLPNDLNDPKLRKKFDKHGKHFGMEGMNFNKQNAELFKQNIRKHINDPDTIPIAGKYTTGNVGDVVHYFNPKTKINVMKDIDGNFVSGWQLSRDQIENLEKFGKIGGSK